MSKFTYHKICYHCLKSKVFDLFTIIIYTSPKRELIARCRLCKNEVVLSNKVIKEIKEIFSFEREFKQMQYRGNSDDWIGYIAPNTLDFYSSNDGKMDRFINSGLMTYYIGKVAIRLNTVFVLKQEVL